MDYAAAHPEHLAVLAVAILLAGAIVLFLLMRVMRRKL